MQTLRGERLYTNEYIRWHNRAYFKGDKVHLDLTLAGFSAVAKGALTLTYRVSEPLYAAWVVNGIYEKAYMEGEGRLAFSAGSAPAFVTFYKLTEQQYGRLEILSLTGEFSPLPPKKRELITFYGDSLTCGYGVEGKDGEPYKKETQNPLLGFAYTLCKKRNADFEMFSYSGISVSEKIFVPEYTLGEICFGYSMYERAPYPYPRASDIVVINIGTNDGCAIDGGVGTAQGLTEGLTAFCRQVKKVHPKAVIVICSGFMDRVPAQKQAADFAYERMKKESNTPVLRFVFPRNTAGANGHPNATAQVEGGSLLAAFLETELKK